VLKYMHGGGAFVDEVREDDDVSDDAVVVVEESDEMISDMSTVDKRSWLAVVAVTAAVAVRFIWSVRANGWSSSASPPETNDTDETDEEADGDEPRNKSVWNNWCGACGKSWSAGGSWVNICPKDGKNSDSSGVLCEKKDGNGEDEETDDNRFDCFSSPPPAPHQDLERDSGEGIGTLLASSSICFWSCVVNDS
jgi:hypothetical protein